VHAIPPSVFLVAITTSSFERRHSHPEHTHHRKINSYKISLPRRFKAASPPPFSIPSRAIRADCVTSRCYPIPNPRPPFPCQTAEVMQDGASLRSVSLPIFAARRDAIRGTKGGEIRPAWIRFGRIAADG